MTALRESEVNPEDAVEQGLLAILESTEIAAGAICLFDARQQVLRLAAERGLSDQGCKSLRHIRRGYSSAWDMPLQSLSNRRVYLIENAAQNRYVPPLIDEPDKMRTVLCLPLQTGNTPVGSLILISTGRKFADQDVARLEAPGRELAVLIEGARARARQAERTASSSAPAPVPDQPYRTTWSSPDSMSGQRYDPASEVMRAKEIAADWERKHQDLAGELAAATAREQRLREELKVAAERLQDLSQSSRGKGTKDEAAQLAQNARLQASLAEAESIAARERLRASEVERKLTEMAELLSGATAREEELRRLVDNEAGGDPSRRTEYIDQSLELARLNARLAEAETALANARVRGEFADSGAGQAQLADAVAEKGRLDARVTEVEGLLAEARQAAQVAESERQSLVGEVAAARAREETLQDELRAAAEQHQRLQTEAEERERQREQARASDTAYLQNELRDALEANQRGNERLAALEARTQELAGQLAATSTREEALREELENASLAHQARVAEMEAQLDHERTLVAELQDKHQSLSDAETGAALDASRVVEWEQRCGALSAQLDEALSRNAATDRELQELRGQLAERSATAAAAAAEKAVEAETLAARLTEAEAARATAEQSATSWAVRHEAASAELAASVTRAEELGRDLESLRAGNTNERVEAEGARAAAQAEAEATRTALAEAQQQIETLTRELDEARRASGTLEDQVAGLQRERDVRAAEALAAKPAAAQAKAPSMRAPANVQRPAPPVAVSATVKSDVKRIAVIDDPAVWSAVKLHGVETLIIAPTDDVNAQLAAAPVDRVLVNLSTRGAFEATLNARAAGTTVPFIGCLLPAGFPRGLALGFIEVARTPLDPDEIVTVLAPFGGRGTRVLTAGADADAFISLRQALSRQGMSVSMAWDGKQASDLLQMVRPEVVVVDLDIPPRSGLSLLVELTATQTIPMIVLLPGHQDLTKRTATELADPAIADRLLPPDRLLDDVRKSGKPK